MTETDAYVAELEYHINNLENNIKDEHTGGVRTWLEGQMSGFRYALALYHEAQNVEALL